MIQRLGLLLLLMLSIPSLGHGEEESARNPLVDHLLAIGPGIHADRVVVTDLEFEDISGQASIEEGKLYLRQLNGRMYQGQAQGEVVIDLHDGTIDISLAVQNMDLADFLMRYAGMEDPPTGTISGTVNLQLPQGVGNLMHGQAHLTMEQGNVVTIGGLTNLLIGNPVAAQNQDRAEAQITIAERHAVFDSFVINSPAVTLFGSGSIEFNGHTDIIFSPRSKPGYLNVIPLAGDILSWTIGRVTRSVGRFRVTGHISNPQFIARPF